MEVLLLHLGETEEVAGAVPDQTSARPDLDFTRSLTYAELESPLKQP